MINIKLLQPGSVVYWPHACNVRLGHGSNDLYDIVPSKEWRIDKLTVMNIGLDNTVFFMDEQGGPIIEKANADGDFEYYGSLTQAATSVSKNHVVVHPKITTLETTKLIPTEPFLHKLADERWMVSKLVGEQFYYLDKGGWIADKLDNAVPCFTRLDDAIRAIKYVGLQGYTRPRNQHRDNIDELYAKYIGNALGFVSDWKLWAGNRHYTSDENFMRQVEECDGISEQGASFFRMDIFVAIGATHQRGNRFSWMQHAGLRRMLIAADRSVPSFYIAFPSPNEPMSFCKAFDEYCRHNELNLPELMDRRKEPRWFEVVETTPDKPNFAVGDKILVSSGYVTNTTKGWTFDPISNRNNHSVQEHWRDGLCTWAIPVKVKPCLTT